MRELSGMLAHSKNYNVPKNYNYRYTGFMAPPVSINRTADRMIDLQYIHTFLHRPYG